MERTKVELFKGRAKEGVVEGGPVEKEPEYLRGESSAGLGVVDAHLLCVRCGYDLFGQGVNEKCPECGAWVIEALRWRDARGNTQARKWLSRVNSGLWIVFLMALVRMVVFKGTGTTSASGVGFCVVLGLVAMFGWYLMTRPATWMREYGPEDTRKRRQMLAALALAEVCGSLMEAGARSHSVPGDVFLVATPMVIAWAAYLVMKHWRGEIGEKVKWFAWQWMWCVRVFIGAMGVLGASGVLRLSGKMGWVSYGVLSWASTLNMAGIVVGLCACGVGFAVLADACWRMVDQARMDGVLRTTSD